MVIGIHIKKLYNPHSSTFIIVKNVETTQIPISTDEHQWNVIHACNGILFEMK